MDELLFKLFVKLNSGSSLLSHRSVCEMPGPDLLLDLKLFLSKQIPEALRSVSGAGDKWSVNLVERMQSPHLPHASLSPFPLAPHQMSSHSVVASCCCYCKEES